MELLKYSAARFYRYYLNHNEGDAYGMSILFMAYHYLLYAIVLLLVIEEATSSTEINFNSKWLQFAVPTTVALLSFLVHRETDKNYKKVIQEYEKNTKGFNFKFWAFRIMAYVLLFAFYLFVWFNK
jgi:cytochrome bd-type quinol oxidase subunit 1